MSAGVLLRPPAGPRLGRLIASRLFDGPSTADRGSVRKQEPFGGPYDRAIDKYSRRRMVMWVTRVGSGWAAHSRTARALGFALILMTSLVQPAPAAAATAEETYLASVLPTLHQW